MSDRPEEQGAVTPHARCPARCVCAQNLTLPLPQRSRRRPSSLRRTQNGSRASNASFPLSCAVVPRSNWCSARCLRSTFCCSREMPLPMLCFANNQGGASSECKLLEAAVHTVERHRVASPSFSPLCAPLPAVCQLLPFAAATG